MISIFHNIFLMYNKYYQNDDITFGSICAMTIMLNVLIVLMVKNENSMYFVMHIFILVFVYLYVISCFLFSR